MTSHHGARHRGARASARRRPSARRTCSRSGSSRGCSGGRRRPPSSWLERKFGGKQEILDANVAAFKAGLQLRRDHRAVRAVVRGRGRAGRAGHLPQHRRARTALAWGLIAAAERVGLPLFYASYPITPASELLHELSRHKNFGVITVQAEDEIAAANMALGAAFAGQLGVTGTSGPGMDLKAETLGLAVIMELPDGDRRRAARAAPRPGCRRRPSRATCCSRCSAATASRRCRSWRRASPSRLLRRGARGRADRGDATGRR